MSPRDARGFWSCCCVTGGRTRALNNCSGNSTRGAAPDADAIGPRTASRPLSLRECHGTPSGLPQGECRRACTPRHALTHEGLFSLKRARRPSRCSVSLPPARRSVSRKADFPQARGKAHRPAVVFPAAGHGRGVTAVLHGTVGLPSDCRFCLAAVCRFNLILWPRKLELNFLAAGVRLEPGVLFPFVFSAE